MHTELNIVLPGNHGRPVLTDLYYTPDGRQKPIVVFCHGFKGFKDWGHFNLFAQAMAEAGFVFVKFNFSHNGGTVAQPIDFPDLEAFGHNNFSIEQDDLGIVIDWVLSNPQLVGEADQTAVSLVGHSRGGGAVVLKAAHDSRVNKVVTWASVDDYHDRLLKWDVDTWRQKGVYFIENGRTKQQMPLYFQIYEDFIANREKLDVMAAARSLTIPAFFIHGTNDEAVPHEAAHHLHNATTDSQLLIIEAANHVFGAGHPWHSAALPSPADQVIEATVAFLRH